MCFAGASKALSLSFPVFVNDFLIWQVAGKRAIRSSKSYYFSFYLQDPSKEELWRLSFVYRMV